VDRRAPVIVAGEFAQMERRGQERLQKRPRRKHRGSAIRDHPKRADHAKHEDTNAREAQALTAQIIRAIPAARFGPLSPTQGLGHAVAYA